jgi:CheY-like chemotaxis protein
MNNAQPKPIHVLVTDDDEDDRLLIKEAFEDGKIMNPVSYFANGKELIDYLESEEEKPDRFSSGSYLILLDLNMPIMGGKETLDTLKKSEKFRKIPVVILTTSRAEEDIVASYESGVNSFISKPITFAGLVDVMKALKKYWLQVVEFPNA